MEDAFFLHMDNGKAIWFGSNGQRMYYYDLQSNARNAITLVTTMKEKESQYTNRGLQ
jgi:hypothetical protein